MRSLLSIRSILAAATAILTLVLAGDGPSRLYAQATMQVIASGLDNPRRLAFGPDGALYVAEAGRGGESSLCEIGPDMGATLLWPVRSDHAHYWDRSP